MLKRSFIIHTLQAADEESIYRLTLSTVLFITHIFYQQAKTNHKSILASLSLHVVFGLKSFYIPHHIILISNSCGISTL